MTAEKIEFSLLQGNEDMYPRPYPATKDIPAWFKAMPSEIEGQAAFRTVKNCPPFLEAMTCGYIIPVAAELVLGLDAQGTFYGRSDPGHILHYHAKSQVKGAPFENLPVLKILNPWLIRTPPGYSTLFLAPLNRCQTQIVPLAGLVETDLFYREVNFPVLLTIPRGMTLTVARGTPFVQAIPIKRDEFQAEFVPLDAQTWNAMNEKTRDLPENYNFYKNNFWRKKHYR